MSACTISYKWIPHICEAPVGTFWLPPSPIAFLLVSAFLCTSPILQARETANQSSISTISYSSLSKGIFNFLWQHFNIQYGKMKACTLAILCLPSTKKQISTTTRDIWTMCSPFIIHVLHLHLQYASLFSGTICKPISAGNRTSIQNWITHEFTMCLGVGML